METERPELRRQALPHYSPDGRWWWDGTTWLSIRPHFWVQVRRGAMPPSVASVALWLGVLFGVNLALAIVAFALWYPLRAVAPDSRYLPFLLSTVAVEGSTGVALSLLIVRRRLARVGAVVLPPVGLAALTVVGTTVPGAHDLVGPIFGGLVVIVLLIVLYLFAAADAKAWFRVPPGGWW